MANNVPPEIPLENDLRLWCEVFKTTVDGTSGALTPDVPDTGRTDIEAFFSTDEELSSATPIGSLTWSLPCVGTSHRYSAVVSGATLTAEAKPTYLDVPVYVHFCATDSSWHETAETMFVDKRPGA